MEPEVSLEEFQKIIDAAMEKAGADYWRGYWRMFWETIAADSADEHHERWGECSKCGYYHSPEGVCVR